MAKEKMMTKNISNKAVVIMLIAVIVVSVTGLGFYISALDNAEPRVHSISLGKVSLNIVEPPMEFEPVTDGGKVSLGIRK
ncbi:MAG: hypothetical protein ABIH82_04565 [Candidatus Woesearchaeota archaeon]|nr:hypothetical protein [Nanoarchaeota archaeon]MBU1622700.1 hypothetical protein [Nanoarchaeota archaeon]MBU1974242.1 hypothetical protein [Nanoarchaeota archaeon]